MIFAMPDIRATMIEASAHPLPPGVSARLAPASMIGTSLEWYDFMIYNTAAALVFNSIFFPTSAPRVGLLLAFSTYAVGYLSRPFFRSRALASAGTRRAGLDRA